MITDTITCYYEGDDRAALDLISLWKSVWNAAGWKTCVLSEATALTHPKYSEMLAKIASLPCINPPAFQRACLLRWLAFTRAPGALADYDVFPVALFPARRFAGFACCDATLQPGFVVGISVDIGVFVDEILAYTPGPDETHVSDQEIMRSNPFRFTEVLDLMRGYLAPRWEKGPLVHFSNDAIGHCPFPGSKYDKIKAVLATL